MTEYTKEGLLQMTKAELLDLAVSLRIVGRSRMNKGELMDAVASSLGLDIAEVGPQIDAEETVSKPILDSKSIFSWLGGYLIGSWTFLQFLDWILIRNGISPYWTDLCLWLLIGILPSFLIYIFNMDRINQFVFKRWEKVVIPMNLIVLAGSILMIFQGSDLGVTTTEISYVNTDGIEETKKVYRQNNTKNCMNTPDRYIVEIQLPQARQLH